MATIKSLGVDLSSDSPEIHPQYFCNYCYLTAKKHLPHSETSCTVCDVKHKEGRPMKSSSCWPSAISTHITSVALPIPSFTLDQLVDNNYKDDVTCSSCKAAVQKPVEVLPCKSLYCCKCALSLTFSSSFTCSSCLSIHESIDSSVQNL
uniref:RING-type domain-containing protein n=1 Tax=Amphimedon queenslandica TaxID=400682 RepID=A0A1X7TM11_AMPQE